jgi:hypothetical protein
MKKAASGARMRRLVPIEMADYEIVNEWRFQVDAGRAAGFGVDRAAPVLAACFSWLRLLVRSCLGRGMCRGGGLFRRRHWNPEFAAHRGLFLRWAAAGCHVNRVILLHCSRRGLPVNSQKRTREGRSVAPRLPAS